MNRQRKSSKIRKAFAGLSRKTTYSKSECGIRNSEVRKGEAKGKEGHNLDLWITNGIRKRGESTKIFYQYRKDGKKFVSGGLSFSSSLPS